MIMPEDADSESDSDGRNVQSHGLVLPEDVMQTSVDDSEEEIPECPLPGLQLPTVCFRKGCNQYNPGRVAGSRVQPGFRRAMRVHMKRDTRNVCLKMLTPGMDDNLKDILNTIRPSTLKDMGALLRDTNIYL